VAEEVSMSPQIKEYTIKQIERMIHMAEILYSESSIAREHIIACLNDRKIEIKEGKWDEPEHMKPVIIDGKSHYC
jgi:hypothetical protein